MFDRILKDALYPQVEIHPHGLLAGALPMSSLGSLSIFISETESS